MGHAHAVLHLKQGRQERLEVKVRHPVQIGLLIHILRHEQPFIRVIGIIGGQGVPVDAVLHAGGTVDELEVALAGLIEQPLAPEAAEHGLVVAKSGEVGDDGLVGDHEGRPFAPSPQWRP